MGASIFHQRGVCITVGTDEIVDKLGRLCCLFSHQALRVSLSRYVTVVVGTIAAANTTTLQQRRKQVRENPHRFRPAPAMQQPVPPQSSKAPLHADTKKSVQETLGLGGCIAGERKGPRGSCCSRHCFTA